MWSIGFSIFSVMSSACNDNFTSFPILIPFIPFSCPLLWLGLPILCWIEVVRVGTLVLFQILAGRLSAFHHWVLFWLGVCQNSFYYVVICSLFTRFGKSFYHEWTLNFIRCFSCIYWDDHVFFVFSFVDVVYHTDWYLYVEPSLWPWDESNLIVVYDLVFMCCWIWFANILLRIFAFIFIKDIGL